jgi:eukaryotic-like serine/threonine-protein kinase
VNDPTHSANPSSAAPKRCSAWRFPRTDAPWPPAATTTCASDLWDLTDRERPHQLGQPLLGHTGPVLSLAFAPDGHTLATASFDQTVRLWDLTDRDRPRLLDQPLIGHAGPVNREAFSPDGQALATAGSDGTVIVWDLSDHDRVRQIEPPLSGHTSYVFRVAFSPDGHTLASGSGDAVRLWDLTNRDRPDYLTSP